MVPRTGIEPVKASLEGSPPVRGTRHCIYIIILYFCQEKESLLFQGVNLLVYRRVDKD